MLLNQMIPVYFHLFTFFLSFIWITNIYSQKAKWSREIGVLVGTHVYLHNINLICRFEEDVGSWNRSSNNTATYPEIDDVIDDHDHDRAHQIRWFLYGWTWMNTRTSQVFAKGWKFSRTSFGSIWTLPVRDLISKKKKKSSRELFFFFSWTNFEYLLRQNCGSIHTRRPPRNIHCCGHRSDRPIFFS